MRFSQGMTFRVALDVVNDSTGAPIATGVGFLWHARSGASFRKGDEFTIGDITGEALWMKSSSPRVENKEVVVFKEDLLRHLKSGMVVQV